MSRSERPVETTAAPPPEPAARDAAGALAPRAASACEVPGPPAELEHSQVLRHHGAGWDGVRALPYGDGPIAGVTRRILATTPDAPFQVRYFELDPGGETTHERHRHVHVVVCFRGRGQVRLGAALHEVGYGDVVYVAPGDPHQFLNPYTEPFGFLCIVDRERDRPEPMGG